MVASWYLCETSKNIQELWPQNLYFMVHWFLTGQIVKVKIFVQGRMLSSTNGSKLIFLMRMYCYETSKNIPEPWPHDLNIDLCTLDTFLVYTKTVSKFMYCFHLSYDVAVIQWLRSCHKNHMTTCCITLGYWRITSWCRLPQHYVFYRNNVNF